MRGRRHLCVKGRRSLENIASPDLLDLTTTDYGICSLAKPMMISQILSPRDRFARYIHFLLGNHHPPKLSSDHKI